LNFIRQSQAADVNPKMAVFTVGPPTGDFRKTLGKAADYVYGITTWLPEMELKDEIFESSSRFAKQFQERFGYQPTTTSPRELRMCSRSNTPSRKRTPSIRRRCATPSPRSMCLRFMVA